MTSAGGDNPSLSNVLTELFECVVQQKDSLLVKAGVTLGQLVCSAEASDPRVQAKCGAIMEEMKVVSGHGGGGGGGGGRGGQNRHGDGRRGVEELTQWGSFVVCSILPTYFI